MAVVEDFSFLFPLPRMLFPKISLCSGFSCLSGFSSKASEGPSLTTQNKVVHHAHTPTHFSGFHCPGSFFFNSTSHYLKSYYSVSYFTGHLLFPHTKTDTIFVSLKGAPPGPMTTYMLNLNLSPSITLHSFDSVRAHLHLVDSL